MVLLYLDQQVQIESYCLIYQHYHQEHHPLNLDLCVLVQQVQLKDEQKLQQGIVHNPLLGLSLCAWSHHEYSRLLKAPEFVGGYLLLIFSGAHLFYDDGETFALQLPQPSAVQCVPQVLQHLLLQESQNRPALDDGKQ
uniref:Uncharacterized protein n=1 Tax=Arundo donax TaxID=35708 RepID=A0A0A9D9L7_ARUDO